MQDLMQPFSLLYVVEVGRKVLVRENLALHQYQHQFADQTTASLLQ
jgi:hypothetical protein